MSTTQGDRLDVFGPQYGAAAAVDLIGAGTAKQIVGATGAIDRFGAGSSIYSVSTRSTVLQQVHIIKVLTVWLLVNGSLIRLHLLMASTRYPLLRQIRMVQVLLQVFLYQ